MLYAALLLASLSLLGRRSVKFGWPVSYRRSIFLVLTFPTVFYLVRVDAPQTCQASDALLRARGRWSSPFPGVARRRTRFRPLRDTCVFGSSVRCTCGEGEPFTLARIEQSIGFVQTPRNTPLCGTRPGAVRGGVRAPVSWYWYSSPAPNVKRSSDLALLSFFCNAHLLPVNSAVITKSYRLARIHFWS